MPISQCTNSRDTPLFSESAPFVIIRRCHCRRCIHIDRGIDSCRELSTRTAAYYCRSDLIGRFYELFVFVVQEMVLSLPCLTQQNRQ